MKKLFVLFALIGLMFFTNAQQAEAVIIDFGRVVPTSGTISYAGGVTPLVGSDISVDVVFNVGGGPTVLHGLSGAMLNFATGDSTGNDASTWLFGPGGTITLTGGIPDLGIADGTTLLTGAFTGTTKVLFISNSLKILGAAFNDIKDQDLAEYFGLNADGVGYGWAGGINLSFNATGTPGSAFTSTTVLSGDITNEPIVPEPATMALLGMGILGLFGLRRKA